MKKYIPWIIFLTFLFPIANLLVFLVRFGPPPSRLLAESLVFAPIGLLSALILFYFYDRAEPAMQKNAIIAGYLLALPLSLLGGLMGGLLGVLWTVLFGVIPLAVGVLLGSYFGGVLAEGRL